MLSITDQCDKQAQAINNLRQNKNQEQKVETPQNTNENKNVPQSKTQIEDLGCKTHSM